MTDLNITRLNATDAEFSAQLQNLLAWDESSDFEIHKRVLEIIAQVRSKGDAAVIDYTNQFDHSTIQHADELQIPNAVLKQAWEALPTEQAQALQTAADRVFAYAEVGNLLKPMARYWGKKLRH